MAAAEGFDYQVVATPRPEVPVSDDYPFAASGVDAVQVSTLGEHWLHHTPDDTIDTIRLDDLRAGKPCPDLRAGHPLAQASDQDRGRGRQRVLGRPVYRHR